LVAFFFCADIGGTVIGSSDDPNKQSAVLCNRCTPSLSNKLAILAPMPIVLPSRTQKLTTPS